MYLHTQAMPTTRALQIFRLLWKLLLSTTLCVQTVHAQTQKTFAADTNLCETAPWQLVWHEEFEGEALDKSKWFTFIDDENWVDGRVADPPVAQAARRAYHVIYKDENVQVNKGNCTLLMRYEPTEWMGARRNFSSGMIMAKNREGTMPLYFERGKFEMRAKLPRATGVWATFWLYGGGNKQNHGSEIDMVEYAPCQSNLNRLPYHIHGFHRGANYVEHNEIGGAYHVPNVDNWHVYTTEWDRHFIRFYMDGNLKATVSRYDNGCVLQAGKSYTEDAADVFPRVDEGMKMLLTLDYTHNIYSKQLLGTCLPLPAWLRNRVKVDAKQPEQQFIIDYVRVYQRRGEVQAYFRQ